MSSKYDASDRDFADKWAQKQRRRLCRTGVQIGEGVLLLKSWWMFCTEVKGLVTTWTKSGPTCSSVTCKPATLVWFWSEFRSNPSPSTGPWPTTATVCGNWASATLWTRLTGGRAVRALAASTAPLWTTTACRPMIRRPLTFLHTSSPLLTISRRRSTQLVVNAPLSLRPFKNHPFCSSRVFFHLSGAARVFVHCAVGVSRSASIVLAYLMIHQHHSLLEAILKVKERRWIFPNSGFLKQLRTLDVKLQEASWVIFQLPVFK